MKAHGLNVIASAGFSQESPVEEVSGVPNLEIPLDYYAINDEELHYNNGFFDANDHNYLLYVEYPLKL